MRAPVIGAIGMSLAVLSGCAGAPGRGAFGTPASMESFAGESRMLQVAATLEEQGDTVAALALYQRATATPDDALIAHIRIGEIHIRTGNHRRAIAAFRAALALEPNSAEALLGLGSTLVQTNDVGGGLVMLRRAAPVVRTAIAYNRLGLAETLAGNMPEAIAALGRAVALAPYDLDIRTNLALAAALDGQSDAAIRAAQEAAWSPQAEARHRRNLIIVLGLCRRGAEALEMGSSDMPAREIKALLARADAILAIKDIRARARALGTILG